MLDIMVNGYRARWLVACFLSHGGARANLHSFLPLVVRDCIERNALSVEPLLSLIELRAKALTLLICRYLMRYSETVRARILAHGVHELSQPMTSHLLDTLFGELVSRLYYERLERILGLSIRLRVRHTTPVGISYRLARIPSQPCPGSCQFMYLTKLLGFQKLNITSNAAVDDLL